jgi:L-iditol 2-dehydrogenase
MKALSLQEYKRLEVIEAPQPEAGRDEVLVRVRACGICGSDVHGFDGSSGRRIPPIIMGHEAAGVVAATGEDVTDLRAGDRVTFDATISCGGCDYCLRGRINLCDQRRVLGVSCGEYRQHGAFAEYIAVPRRIVYRLPDALSFEEAAMVEAVSVAVHAVNRTPVALGDTAVVVGAGMIGLLTIQALRAAGCGRVFSIDIDETRLALARQLGAEACDSAADIRADIAMEAVGTGPALQTAIAAVRKGGALTLVGNVTPTVPLPLQAVVTRELTLYGTCASNHEYPTCMELMTSGKIRVAPLLTATAPLEDGQKWFERLYAREPGLMKVILQP